VEGIIEFLKRQLEGEDQSEEPLQLPSDTYTKIATYAQSLRRVAGSNNSEITTSLIERQMELIEGMVRRLLGVRIRKATSQGATQLLLPEERYVCSLAMEFGRRKEEFVSAVVNGQPSFISMAYENELGRGVTVRFLKSVEEIIGFDLKRYGPFEPQDLAVLPSADADILAANGEAVVVHPRASG